MLDKRRLRGDGFAAQVAEVARLFLVAFPMSPPVADAREMLAADVADAVLVPRMHVAHVEVQIRLGHERLLALVALVGGRGAVHAVHVGLEANRGPIPFATLLALHEEILGMAPFVLVEVRAVRATVAANLAFEAVRARAMNSHVAFELGG